jgi:hypothetical protein
MTHVCGPVFTSVYLAVIVTVAPDAVNGIGPAGLAVGGATTGGAFPTQEAQCESTGCVQEPFVQMSAEQAFPSSVQLVPFGTKLSTGQEELEPVQVSATSHSPAEPRQIAPALPGVWTAPVEELQESTVQGLPSSTLGAGPPVQVPAPSQ